MPGFNVADVVTCLLRRVNFVGLPHPAGMQKTEAFRAGDGVKASRIQGIKKAPSEREKGLYLAGAVERLSHLSLSAGFST
jgi:hypothetical protein